MENVMELVFNARIELDDPTVSTCFQAISIHAKSKGLKGLILKFNEADNNPSIFPLTTEEEVDAHLFGKSHNKERYL